MSRGPGRIERAIATALATAPPGATFSLSELGALVYPEVTQVRRRIRRRWYSYEVNAYSIERRHRVALWRAAKRVVPGLWWDWTMPHEPEADAVFFNRCDAQSRALAKIRRFHPWEGPDKWHARLAAGDLGHHWNSLSQCEREAAASRAARDAQISPSAALEAEKRADRAAWVKCFPGRPVQKQETFNCFDDGNKFAIHEQLADVLRSLRSLPSENDPDVMRARMGEIAQALEAVLNAVSQGEAPLERAA